MTNKAQLITILIAAAVLAAVLFVVFSDSELTRALGEKLERVLGALRVSFPEQ